MDIIKAEFVVTTPMFLGAGSLGKEKQPECADGVRGASVKGALRAAYRALNWSRIRKATADDRQALHQLHTEEAAIFGSAAKDKKGGQAQFLLRVLDGEAVPEKEIAGRSGELEYLLGMGLYHFRNGMLREHIPANTTFKLQLALKPSLSAAQKQQLQDTLLFWGLTGGLGSRTRKGFGSVSITALERAGKTIDLPTTENEFKTTLKNLVGTELVAGLAPLTAFSSQTKMQVSGTDRDALCLLKSHGRHMALYRGYGRKNGEGTAKVLGVTAEQNFTGDHDWAYALSKRKADASYLPRRAVFGLPHPYFLSGASFHVSVDAETGRRASPLLAHVHRFPDGKHLLLHTLFQCQFLPSSTPVLIDSHFKEGRKVIKAQDYSLNNIDNEIDWEVLELFLQRFNPSTEDVIYG